MTCWLHLSPTAGALTLICSPFRGYRFSIIASPLIRSFPTVKKIFLEHLLQRFFQRGKTHTPHHGPTALWDVSSVLLLFQSHILSPRAFQTPCLWDRKCSFPWLCLCNLSSQPLASLIPNLVPTLNSLCLPYSSSLTYSPKLSSLGGEDHFICPSSPKAAQQELRVDRMSWIKGKKHQAMFVDWIYPEIMCWSPNLCLKLGTEKMVHAPPISPHDVSLLYSFPLLLKKF